MTWRELKKYVNEMEENRLDEEVTVYIKSRDDLDLEDLEEDCFYPLSGEEIHDRVEDGDPFLII